MSITVLAPSATTTSANAAVVDSVLADPDRVLSALNEVDWSGASGDRLLAWGGRLSVATSRLARYTSRCWRRSRPRVRRG